jgi:hypothetical protein
MSKKRHHAVPKGKLRLPIKEVFFGRAARVGDA